MEIIKEKVNGYNKYIFVKGEKKFTIFFGGNGDLYWSLNTKDDYDTFTIGIDDNFKVYSLFLKLYLGVKNADVYDEDPYYFGEDSFEKSISVKDNQRLRQKRLKQKDYYKDLFDGEKITWISDNSDYQKEDVVQISYKDDTFILEFARRDRLDNNSYLLTNPGYTISIRFRNSGSSYDPFNLLFMDMYNSLNNINLNRTVKEEISGQNSLFK